jgi:hypothetical protein
MGILSSKRMHNQRLQTFFDLVCLFILLVSTVGQASAANGTPESIKFGYGMRIDPWGREVDFALNIAAQSGLDWIGIDFNWQMQWTEASQTLDLSPLNKSMTFAAENGLNVLLSITNPPEWANTPQGPDPEMTAGLVAQFARLYPGSLRAVELFPGANTRQGWGADANPRAYLKLIKNVAQTLSATGQDITLVAGGLVPLTSPHGPGDMDDLLYLTRLYESGAAGYIPVVSLRLPSLHGEPLAAPWESEARVLRRYELVRDLMLENDHSDGMIWLTGFSWPELEPASGTTNELVSYNNMPDPVDTQVQWFSQAYQIIKSQLYIGAAFYSCLNPPASTDTHRSDQGCLIQLENNRASVHPAFTALSQAMALEDSYQEMISTGSGEVDIPFDPESFPKSSTP